MTKLPEAAELKVNLMCMFTLSAKRLSETSSNTLHSFVISPTLTMEAASSTETSVNIYQAVRCHIPGDTKRQEKFPY
jgi:Golgi nucleoside diphosphatase